MSIGVYFFHIPKTAGVSTWRFLEHAYPASQICPYWLWDQLIRVSPNELRNWDIFRGHFLSHLELYTGRQFKTFTLLRDPVQRTISHYYHVRRSPEHPFYAHAVRLTIKEFCMHPSTRHMVVNYQCGYLAKVSFRSGQGRSSDRTGRAGAVRASGSSAGRGFVRWPSSARPCKAAPLEFCRLRLHGDVRGITDSHRPTARLFTSTTDYS